LAAYGESNVVIQACVGEGNTPTLPGEPQEPDFPIVIPSGAVYTYMFEDLWPLYGDYDMNDVVFKLSDFTTYVSTNNQVGRFEFDLTLLAVGASYDIGLAMQLDQTPASNIRSVTYTSSTIADYIPYVNAFLRDETTGVEKDEPYAVIPLANEVHTLFHKTWFINTVESRPDGAMAPVTIHVKVDFATPVDPLQLNINNLNFFIMSKVDLYKVDNANGVRRREVHLAGYQPTAKADTKIFGNHNDNSINGQYTYVSNDGLAWAIAVPAEVRWMNEWTRITEGYLQLKNWMQGELDAETGRAIQWWEPNGTNMDESKLYTQP
ncbi:MAG: LruC domain-containing protein, partial [Prevotellaceae bacterium]|nr:LruC domain-containing protein [Prevotellaceae bacterium]